MTAEDSTVITVPLGTDVSWPVLCVPLRLGCSLPREHLPGLRAAGEFMAQAEVMAAADVEGWQRMAAGQHPWQDRQAEGILHTQQEW